MVSVSKDLQFHRYLLWTGPAMIALLLTGFAVIGGYVPPPAPSLSAEAIAQFYQSQTNAIRFGLMICIVAATFLGTWGVGLALKIRDCYPEGQGFFYAQLCLATISSVATILGPVVWSTAAFRPHQYPAYTLLMINDLGWMIFLITWPPFSLWFITVGLAILQCPQVTGHIPRWVGYYSFWAALLIVPAGLIVFFKSGPFAWNGVLAFYVPVAVILSWMVAVTIPALRAP
jgi:hypothetical protein